MFLVVNTLMVGRERRRTAEQRDLAVEQRDIADARTREAVERAETLERQLVINRVNRAYGEWEANSVAAAEHLLDECPPALAAGNGTTSSDCAISICSPTAGMKGIGVWGVAFSPDGKLIASGAGGGYYGKPGQGEVVVWEAATGREVFSRRGLKGGVQCVAFSPDGRRVAVGIREHRLEHEGELRVWDLATGREVFIRTRPGLDVMSVGFSPDGTRSRRATASIEDTTTTGLCRLWDVATGEEVATFPGQPGGVVRGLQPGWEAARPGQQRSRRALEYPRPQAGTQPCCTDQSTRYLFAGHQPRWATDRGGFRGQDGTGL